MKQHIAITEDNGVSSISLSDAPVYAAADYEGWEALSLETAGLFLFSFRIAPGAVDFPMHASPDTWLAYVVSGGGTLFSGDTEAKVVNEAEFQPGDMMTFGPNTQHAWRNGPAETILLLVKKA